MDKQLRRHQKPQHLHGLLSFSYDNPLLDVDLICCHFSGIRLIPSGIVFGKNVSRPAFVQNRTRLDPSEQNDSSSRRCRYNSDGWSFYSLRSSNFIEVN
tara:strand:+ start:410 stop:706 length:297 start_codon:yes stop_codon:yes gene_type:complete